MQIPCRWRIDASHEDFSANPDEFRLLPGLSGGVLEVGGMSRYVGRLGECVNDHLEEHPVCSACETSDGDGETL